MSCSQRSDAGQAAGSDGGEAAAADQAARNTLAWPQGRGEGLPPGPASIFSHSGIVPEQRMQLDVHAISKTAAHMTTSQ